MKRFLVFSSRTRSTHLCVCMARDRRHALAVARQLFTLKRDAYAVQEATA
jgi:hypothetical protein